MSYKTAKANEELKAVYSEYVSAYKIACTASRDKYMGKLSPGAKVPEHGKLYDQADKDAFSEKCSELRARAHEITGDILKDLRAKSTEAPTAEAVNAITLLGMRKNITKSEVSALLDQYGSNPLCWKSITDIAEARDIHGFGEHPVDVSLKALERVDAGIDKNITQIGAETKATEGCISLVFAMDIDSALPTD